MNNYAHRRRHKSLAERDARQADKRIAAFSNNLTVKDDFISAYIRKDREGNMCGYTTQYVNGIYVGIRGGSDGLFSVQIGFSAEGGKPSAWMTKDEANRFIYENTKG